MADDYTLGTSECNLAQVQAGPPKIPPQYAMNLGMGGNGAMRFSQAKTKGRKGRGKK